MSPKLLALLARHYGFDRRARTRLGPLSDAERADLAAAGLELGAVTAITHDSAMHRLRDAASALTEADVTGAYLAGLTSAFPRGRQPLISYAFARRLPLHEKQCDRHGTCLVCGLPETADLDAIEQEVRLCRGSSWNELPHHYVIDLDTFDPNAIPADAIERGRSVLTQLLRLVEAQPPETTPGKLEKAIAKAGLLPPDIEKYGRYGLLITLAETGLLPNPPLAPSWRSFTSPPERWAAGRKVKGAPRSDIPLPLAAWRGAFGVDWDAASALFGVERAGR